jgi:hypothetical protein
MTRMTALAGWPLLFLVIAAAPAAARGDAAERAETRQLNLQAARDARTAETARSPDFTVKDAAAGAPADTPPAAAPTAPVQVAAADAARPLTAIANPPSRIATANVFDRDGALIGAVQKVNLNPGGIATAVNIALMGKDERIVTLDAAAVRYDAAGNRIVTDRSRAEIMALPDARGGLRG